MTITDRIEVDIEGLSKFDDHAAIPAAEPLEAVVKDKKTHVQRMLTVHGFTASGHALVLDPSSNHLVRVWEATQTGGVFQRIQRRTTTPTAATGPFTPAPPGLFAMFRDETRVPVVFYDVHGRPVIIDKEELSHELCTWPATTKAWSASRATCPTAADSAGRSVAVPGPARESR